MTTPPENTPPCKCNVAVPDNATYVQETNADCSYWVLRCKHGRICVRIPAMRLPQ